VFLREVPRQQGRTPTEDDTTGLPAHQRADGEIGAEATE